jgi:prepilin-type processing-associated H-X9-DG protein
MTTNFLYAQAPNRKGNISKDPAKLTGGVTAITNPKGSTAYADGHVGAPAAGGKVNGCNQPVQVSRPKANTGSNFGYMAEGKPWLK